MLIRANMTNCPQGRSLLQQACVLGQDVFPEQLKVVRLTQKVGAGPCLYQLTVEVNWVLDSLVLDWEDLDAHHDLVKEEFAEDVGRLACLSLLS